MDTDEIITLARQVGFAEIVGEFACNVADLQRFAHLVAQREREEAAKIAETLGVHPSLNIYNGGPDWYKHGKSIAAAIRQRGKQ